MASGKFITADFPHYRPETKKNDVIFKLFFKFSKTNMNSVNALELQTICQNLEFPDMVKLRRVSRRLYDKIKRLPRYQILNELKSGKFDKRKFRISYVDYLFTVLTILLCTTGYFSLRYIFNNYTYQGMIITLVWASFKQVATRNRNVNLNDGLLVNFKSYSFALVDLVLYATEYCIRPEKTTSLLFRIVSIVKQVMSLLVIDEILLRVYKYLNNFFGQTPYDRILENSIAMNTKESNSIGQKILCRYGQAISRSRLKSYLLGFIKYDNLDMYIWLKDKVKNKDAIIDFISPSIDMLSLLVCLYFDSTLIMTYWLDNNLLDRGNLLQVLSTVIWKNTIQSRFPNCLRLLKSHVN